jgi:hypothetical protein
MIIQQTNDGLQTANSYVTTAELSAYALNRGIILNSDLEQLLFRAMDVLESKQYKSEPFNETQSTLFPRMGVGIARPIKQAQLQLAIMYDSLPATPVTPIAQTKSEAVDVIKVEYFESKVTESPIITLVNDLLKPYLAGQTVSPNFRVRRG